MDLLTFMPITITETEPTRGLATSNPFCPTPWGEPNYMGQNPNRSAYHKGGCIWNVPTFSVITPQSVRIIKSRSLIFLCFKISLLFTELKQTKENEFYKHKYCFAHAQYTSWFWTDLFLNCYLNYLLHGFYIGHENLKILKNHIL